MTAFYNDVIKLRGVSEEDELSKRIYPTELTMMNINAGITIPYYGDRDEGNSLTTMLCMSCETGIAATSLHKNCHAVYEHLELTIKAY